MSAVSAALPPSGARRVPASKRAHERTTRHSRTTAVLSGQTTQHRTLLDAALAWSEARGSRVLCTTRRPDSDHAAYRVENTFVLRRIPLTGLGHTTAQDDALDLEDSMIVATIVQGLVDPSTLSDLMPHEAAAEDEPDE
jgi:hypothetical protein